MRRLKGSYLSYVMIFLFAYFAMASFSSVLSVYLTGIGKSASEMSFVVSSSGLFSFIMVPITGYLCDRTGRPRMICAVLLVLLGVCAILFGGSGQVWTLFLLNGLIMSLSGSAMAVSERLASACRFRYGTLRVWGTFGYAAGAQAAGIAVGSFPPWVLFSLVAASALLAAVGYLCAEDPLPAGVQGAERPNNPGEKVKLSSFLTQRYFLLYLLIAFLFSCGNGVNMNFAPLLLNSLGVSTGTVGTVLFFSTLVEIPIIVFSNRFMDRFSGKALLLAAFGSCLFQFLIYAFAPAAWAVVAVMVLIKAVSGTLFMMIILKMVHNLVRPELTTTGISVVNAVNSLATIVMQNISGFVADHSGIRQVYLLLSLLLAVGMILTLFLKVGNSEKVFG